jgi:hypothetical protein
MISFPTFRPCIEIQIQNVSLLGQMTAIGFAILADCRGNRDFRTSGILMHVLERTDHMHQDEKLADLLLLVSRMQPDDE